MKQVIVLLILLSFGFIQAQTTEQLLEQCENVKNDGDYKKLIQVADLGLQNSGTNSYLKARFCFYKAYGFEYDNNQYEKAIPFFEKSWQEAKKNQNLKEETLAIMRLNYLYYSTKQFKKREDLITQINRILDTTKSIYTQGILNGSLGEYYLDKSEISKFIGYKLKAIEYRKKFPKDDKKNIVNIGISYSQIGQAYIKMKQFQKGIEYANLAKPYLKESANAMAFLYNDYIKCYTNLKAKDSIQKYYNEIYLLVTKEDSLHICVSSANKYFAEYFITKNQINQAKTYANKALEFAKKSNDAEILMEAKITSGKLLFHQKKFSEAISLLKEASAFAYEFDKNSFITINKIIAHSYEELGNWKDAFRYHEIYARTNEEMLNESAKQSIANAEARFQNKYKQEKIEFLSAENKIKSLEITATRRNQIYLGIGALLLFIIAGLLYKQNKNRLKTNQKLQALNTKLDTANKNKARFFSIINHDLRAPVANLLHFLHLQQDNPELLDEESKARLQQKTTTGAENLLTSMEDLLLWSKGQMENFEPQFKNYSITELFSDTEKHFSSVEKVVFSFENTQNIHVTTDENYLKTIVRNLTSNAVKALNSKVSEDITPTIIWKAYFQDNNVCLSISDNGPGGTKEKFKALYDDTAVTGLKTGLGLHLIKDLAKAINCEIEVKTEINHGTKFILSLNSI